MACLLAGTLSACLMARAAVQDKPAATALEVIWTKQVEIVGQPRMIVGQRAVFLATAESGLAAYSLEDRRMLWQSASLADAELAIAGKLVAIARSNAVEAFDQDTGRSVWSAQLESSGSPLSLFATDRLIIATEAQDIRAWRLDGSAAWSHKTASPPTTRVVASADALLVALETPEMVALDPATGGVKWRSALPTRATSLAASGDRVVFNGADGALYACRVEGALKQMWHTRQSRRLGPIGDPVLDERNVYVTLVDNTLKAFDRDSGSQRWTQGLGSRPFAGAIQSGGSLFVPLVNGVLAQMTAATGAQPAAPKKPDQASVRLNAAAASPAGVFAIVTGSDSTRTLVAWGTKRQ